MPIYEYKCPRGHVTEKIILSASKAPAEIECHKGYAKRCCFYATMVDASKTGTPVFKRGSGGFHKPSD